MESPQAIKKALLSMYQLKQKKSHYHYRYTDITNPSILKSGLNTREALSPEGIQVMETLGYDPLDVILEKLFQLGQQSGYRIRSQELTQQ